MKKTVTVKILQTTYDYLQFKIKCEHHYYKNELYAYYITALPMRRNCYGGVDVYKQFQRRELHTPTTRFNQKNFTRIIERMQAAVENNYLEQPDTTYEKFVLDKLLVEAIDAVKKHLYIPAPEAKNLRVRTVTDDAKDAKRTKRKLPCQKFQTSN